jgi:hypothetical protein
MGNLEVLGGRVRTNPVLAAAVAAAVAWVVWILLLPAHGWSRHISNVGLTVMPLVAAARCALQARNMTGRLRRGWFLLGGSCLAWGLGMVVWTGYESIGGREVPFPSAADIGYLATVPLTVAALLLFPAAPQRRAAQARTVVDGLLVGASLLVVSWVLALGPVVRGGASGPLAAVIGIAYPVGDVIVGTIVLYALGRSRLGSPLGRATLLLLSGGLLAISVADSGFSYLALQGAYASGMRIDAGWFVGYLLVFVAAGRAPTDATARMEPPLTSRSPDIVPFAAAGLAAATMIGALVRNGADPVLLGLGAFLALAFLARAALVAADENQLRKAVEAWVPVPRDSAEDWLLRTFAGDQRRSAP